LKNIEGREEKMFNEQCSMSNEHLEKEEEAYTTNTTYTTDTTVINTVANILSLQHVTNIHADPGRPEMGSKGSQPSFV
jgi:hypothetical protein